jgi:hypothetical protein
LTAAEALARARAAGAAVRLHPDSGEPVVKGATPDTLNMLRQHKTEIVKLLIAESRPEPRRPFEHYCHCGRWGAFGYGVSLRNDRPGEWFCADHRPAATEKKGDAS